MFLSRIRKENLPKNSSLAHLLSYFQLYHTHIQKSSTNCKHSTISNPQSPPFMQQPSAQITISSKTLSSQIQISQIATIPPSILFQSKKSSRNPLKTPKLTNFSGLKTDNVFLIHFSTHLPPRQNPHKKRAGLSTDSKIFIDIIFYNYQSTPEVPRESFQFPVKTN